MARPTVAAGAWPAVTVVAAQGADAAGEGAAKRSATIAARGAAAIAATSRRGGTGNGIRPAIGTEIRILDSAWTQVDRRSRSRAERLPPSVGRRPLARPAAA